MPLTSASGLVCLLDNNATETKEYALKRLNDMVGEFWGEISGSIGKIETLYEDSKFPYNKLAALLASKVYYHLASYEDALYFALCAEDLLDLQTSSEYVDTIVSRCIDKYIDLRAMQHDGNDSNTMADDRIWSPDSPTYMRLEQLVNNMFAKCFEHKQYKQALGLAIETHRQDIFEEALIQADDREGMLRYTYRAILKLIENSVLRKQLLKILVSVYAPKFPDDAINMCQCLVLLDDPQQTAQTLEDLLMKSDDATVVMAYQIAFDLYESANQMFIQRLIACLSQSESIGHLMRIVNVDRAVLATASSTTEEPKATTTKPADQSTADQGTSASSAAEQTSDPAVPNAAPSVDMDESPAVEPQLSEADQALKKKLSNLVSILSGTKVIELHLQFLIRNNKADLRLLERIRDEVRHTVTHNATVLANGIMHCGTTSDQFLRDHLNWLGRAVNWAKFTATATLGVIHRGHEKEALRLMSAYLPKDASGSSGSVYTEGGGLFALGLIHANHGGQMTEYLLRKLSEATAEPVRHGACLGVGLAAMGTGREDIYEQLKNNLYQDDAITGEAAGLAIGLVMLGTGSDVVIQDCLRYAQETSHEKIVRGLALGLALTMYGRLEEADNLIDTLLADNNPILRWAGACTIAMAYSGTGNNSAVKRLLHTAVSDTDDDVRRWALTGLGFILFKTPSQVPALVSLLSESYHPHLRYGAAMAIGIACAGTGMKEAVSLLETMYEGPVPFVRQGALIATAMVMIQQNGVTMPKSTEFRERCLRTIGDRHEDLMTKYGAILSCGILDAGGCNMTISLQTLTGNNNMPALVGMLVFQNFWFWYPLTNFLSLTLTPTTLITLNKDLQMPEMQFSSNAKPSVFAYPQPLQPEKEKKREKVETVVLSVTAKQRKKEAERKLSKASSQAPSIRPATTGSKEEKMDVDSTPAASTSETKEESPIVPETKPSEPNHCMLNNPARVMRAQQRVISLPENSRYQTIKPISQSGILMVLDRRPGETERFVELVHGHGPTSERLKTRGGRSDTGSSGSAPSALSGGGNKFPASTIAAHLEDDDDDEDEDEVEEEQQLEDEAMSEPSSAAADDAKGATVKEPNPPEAFTFGADDDAAEKDEVKKQADKPDTDVGDK